MPGQSESPFRIGAEDRQGLGYDALGRMFRDAIQSVAVLTPESRAGRFGGRLRPSAKPSRARGLLTVQAGRASVRKSHGDPLSRIGQATEAIPIVAEQARGRVVAVSLAAVSRLGADGVRGKTGMNPPAYEPAAPAPAIRVAFDASVEAAQPLGTRVRMRARATECQRSEVLILAAPAGVVAETPEASNPIVASVASTGEGARVRVGATPPGDRHGGKASRGAAGDHYLASLACIQVSPAIRVGGGVAEHARAEGRRQPGPSLDDETAIYNARSGV